MSSVFPTRSHQLLHVKIAADKNALGARKALPDVREQIQAVPPRHPQVCDHQWWLLALEALKRLLRRTGGGHAHSSTGQLAAQGASHPCIIINNEDTLPPLYTPALLDLIESR